MFVSRKCIGATSRSYLIAGLDCGMDCWTGLMDWIVERQNVELILVCSCISHNGQLNELKGYQVPHIAVFYEVCFVLK